MCDNCHPFQCVLRAEMDTLVCIVFIAFSLLVIAGSVEIENCNDKLIDILEDTNNTILCKAFHQNATIEWSIERDGQEKQRVATCDPSSYCLVPKSDHFAAQWSPSHSTLFYQQHDRDKDARTKVFCESQFAVGPRTASCTFNLIKTHTPKPTRGTTPASSSPAFSPATDNVDSTSSPGVSLQTTKDSVDYTNRQTPTLGTTPATRSPDVLPPTTNVLTTTSPDVSLLTTKDSVDYTSPKTQKKNDLPLGAIVGGIVAVVAVVIVVVVVVVVFVRRKRKQKAAGSAHWSGNDTATDNDDFAEHLNPIYVTSEDLDDTDITDHKPSATTVRSSPNTHNGHPAAPHSLEADMHTTVDGEASHAPSSAADMFGVYGDIGFGSNGSKRVPQKDEYAVVDKSRAQKGPASSANTCASSPAHTTEGSDEYAVVDKSSSGNKTAKSIASDLPDDTANKAGADVYAQVNKPAKKVKVAEPETEGAAYAQVQKPKPAVKPKISAKPSSKKDVTQRDAEDDDEYHTLSHTRGSPHTQDQADLQ